jgi:plastocyanin
MIITFCQASVRSGARIALVVLFANMSIVSSGRGDATPDKADVIDVKMGGYRFMPHEITLRANTPAVLRLVNTDNIVTHNFTLKIPDSSVDIDVDAIGGESVDVQIGPLPVGSYPFHCGSKLLFFESHREKGMEGTLIVMPE